MPQLTKVLAEILRSVASARVEADATSARLATQYQKDPVLSCFPVPRVDIKELNIHLKFALTDVRSHHEVIVDAKKLQELNEQSISSLDMTTTISNYDVLTTETEAATAKFLVERDK